MTYSGELARDLAHLIHPLHQPQAQAHGHVWLRGEGAELIDHTGQRFLDALAGLWNVLVGHGRVELAEAASRQMRELAFASAYAGSSNRPAIELAERLAGLCYPNIGKFFFTCGGAEANETAIKTARYYWKRAGHPGKYKVVSGTYAYHGTTLAAMSATGLASYWPMFEPRVPGFVHIASPYPYRFAARAGDPRSPGEQAADLLEQAIQEEGPDTVAAFLAEPVQGAGGVIVPPDDYWPRIRQICDKYGILLVSDEVMSGWGRTGEWFAVDNWKVVPDIITTAKGITSGYAPLGAAIVSDKIAQFFDDKYLYAGLTYNGHALAVAAALAAIEVYEEDKLIENARTVGKHLGEKLEAVKEKHPSVGDVRYIGLFSTIELVQNRESKEVMPAAVMGEVGKVLRQNGLFTFIMANNLGSMVFVVPPLCITKEQLDEGLAIVEKALEVADKNTK